MIEEPVNSDPKHTPTAKLRLLMFFRVLIITFLLGATVVVQLRDPWGAVNVSLTGLYIIIIAIYLLTFFYVLILPRFTPVRIQAYIQSIGDVLMITGIIYLTGGIESIFSFMYIWAIINASFILYRKGAFLIASFSIITYGLILDLQYYQYITPFYTRLDSPTYSLASDVLYRILINLCAFYLVAYLSGYLSSQVEDTQRRLQAKETDLKRLEDLNDSIVKSIESGLMTLDLNGRILSCNPAAERITGFTSNQIKSHLYTRIFKDLSLPALSDSEDIKTQPVPYIFTRPDGQPLYLEISLQGLKDSANINWGRLLVFQDKTRIHQMEEEVQRVGKLAAAGEVAAGIAHEIRNPLASMSGSIQMLEAELKGKKDHAPLIKIIRREMDRLENIVRDFLLFARPRSGNPVHVNLLQATQDIINDFNRQVEQKDAATLIAVNCSEVFIHFDPLQFEQIMWNLLLNAKDAIADGGSISVALEPDEVKKGMARVIVSDTGHGIPEVDLPHIFDLFYTTKERGTGLGLPIVSRILEGGGGRIQVFSQPQIGTIFTIYLPRSQ
ncbi:MAG: PAS domain-containing protein [Deltaproteobacteria bacterium]|nr:PAS domain-containing protein [Deltaproteobacteria bacterium]MBW2051538.1 PAS domain-containing protein [Deltaproteobacteria bacterium]MBW2140103.1 PAS domain-containing protein [Deltaproteobacteria bacterium]MBW2322028.1 PAS domain-containing protein [Deltaproteobacteria bacterium]